MAINLLQFETFAEKLLHDMLVRWLQEHVQLHELAVQLTRAMEDAQGEGQQAPDRYWIYLNPDDLAVLQAEQPELEEALRTTIIAVAREAGLHLGHQPVLELDGREGQARHTVAIAARCTPRSGDSTMALSEKDRAELKAATRPPQAYLVVDGKRVVPLVKPVTSLGRLPDNDVIVDDARVSRRHAQVRLRYGRYVLYDLGSRGGTFVNGERVSECVLAPADIVSLAGCDMIYGEDSEDTGPRAGGPDRPARPQPPARPSGTGHTQVLPAVRKDDDIPGDGAKE